MKYLAGKVSNMKSGDIAGKPKVSKGWKKSGALKYKEVTPESRCMSSTGGNAMGSHKRMKTTHNQGARGKDNTLENASHALGSHTRTFRKGIPEVAPCSYHGSGSKKSKELGK